jgi:hypothetical protein
MHGKKKTLFLRLEGTLLYAGEKWELYGPESPVRVLSAG